MDLFSARWDDLQVDGRRTLQLFEHFSRLSVPRATSRDLAFFALFNIDLKTTWQHGHEGGAERGDRVDHRPA
jgi:hypothetical protein